jgi:snRNA-activating protein complex subunit 3
MSDNGLRTRGVGVDGFAIERAVNVAVFKSRFGALHDAAQRLVAPRGVAPVSANRPPLPLDDIRPKSRFEQVEERIQAGLDDLLREEAELAAAAARPSSHRARVDDDASLADTSTSLASVADTSTSLAPAPRTSRRRKSAAEQPTVLPHVAVGPTVIVLPPMATEAAHEALLRQAAEATRAKRASGRPPKAPSAAPSAAAPVAAGPVKMQVVAQSDAMHKSERYAMLRALGDASDASDVLSEREVLLTVVLMQANRDVRMLEFDVLASQTLCDVVDMFDCPSSRNALALPECRNQMMYIEGTFYDDTRHAGALRYSEPLVAWLRQCGESVAHNVDLVACHEARVADMQSATLLDLTLRLHAPYLYVHQGDCAHVFAFAALRLACESDPPRRSAYPRLVARKVPVERRCAICEIYPARFVTVADKWAPDDPCLFCEKCYQPLHYDEHGELLPNWPEFGGAEFVQDVG